MSSTSGSTPARGWRRWAMVTFAVLAAAALWWLAGVWRAQADNAPDYVTAQADIGPVAPTVIASGTVNPVNTIQVGSYVSGVIQSLACDFNTEVKAGQLCARLDPRPYQSAVEQESANLAVATAQLAKDRANLAFASANLQRDTDLFARQFVSRQTLDATRNAFNQAQSQVGMDEASVAQRRAALNTARINLGYTSIVSPVDGTVVSRNVTQGQTVAASFQTPTLFLIATDLSKMQVDTNVSESDIGRVALGNAASFTVEAFPERRFQGHVIQVRQAPQTVQNVITYDVVIDAPNPDAVLKPGMTASARIVTARRDQALRVPDTALRYVPASAPQTGQARPRPAPARGGASVWVLRGGKPQQVSLVTGLDDDVHTEVVSGDLRAGDTVIVGERKPGARSGNGAGGAPLPRL